MRTETSVVQITIPYRRGCFSPTMQAYLQSIEATLSARMREQEPAIAQALRDCVVYGRGVLRVP